MTVTTKPPLPSPWMELDADMQVRSLGEGTEAEREDGGILPVSRRSFLKALGLSGVISVAACERMPIRHALPYLVPPEEITPGELTYYASTCAGCAAACGLRMGVRDGRPIKLEGLGDVSRSGGGLCATGQAEVRGLYDAGRWRDPQLDGSTTTWTEADRLVRERLAAVGGAGGVFVVAKTIVSPTARATIATFLDPYGGTLIEYDAPVDSASGVLEAYQMLDGRARVPSLALERTDLLVGLGVDLLGAGDDPVAHTAAYAARRRRRSERDFRHVHIEGSLSLTGAAADERLQATAGERRLVALWLLQLVSESVDNATTRRVRGMLGALPALPSHDAKVRALAQELIAHRGRALIVSGAQSRTEQLAVALLNRALDADGRTLDLEQDSRTRRGIDAATRGFVETLERGGVNVVFFLGCNPVEEWPDGTVLADRIRTVPLSVAMTDRPHGTARACRVVAAAHHALECWGDAAPSRNVLTLAQPGIRPLFNTRHPVENFLHWSGAQPADYREHLRGSWRAHVFEGGNDRAFEAFWSESLARGGVSRSVAAASRWGPDEFGGGSVPPGVSDVALASQLRVGPLPGEDTLEAELIAEVALRDGRHSFNPWLREMPDPLTRAAWVGTVRVAPRRAQALGVQDGDVLALQVGEQAIELPVRVLPGQHPDVLGVPVGYGLVDGDAGSPARNGYQLARRDERGRVRSQGLTVAVTKVGRVDRVPVVQPQLSAEGRPIIGQVSRPDDHVGLGHHGKVQSLWKERHYETHWEMVIDLDACTGCSACVIACQAENNLPVVGPEEVARHHDMSWLRIDRYFDGSPDAPDVLFEPMLCSQCDNAPCETVCPVAATVHGHDGLNNQAYNRCVGTRYCANNCPYKVRRFNWFDYTPKDPLERMVLNPDVVVRERGVMEKCTFCVQRIQRGRIAAKLRDDGSPIEVETACQQSCPAKAIHFGDAARPDSGLEHLKHANRAFQVLADLGVEPSVSYLARVRRRDEGGDVS